MAAAAAAVAFQSIGLGSSTWDCNSLSLSKLEGGGGMLTQALCLAHSKAEYWELAWVIRIEIFR